MWRIDGTKANWNSQFQLDLTDPAAGIEVNGAKLLRTRWSKKHTGLPLNLVESYVRGHDCIANYAPIPPDQVQPQIYWRGSKSPQAKGEGLEMVMSMQTSLLDSDPLIEIVSELPAGEQLAWCEKDWKSCGSNASLHCEDGHEGLLLLRPEGTAWSYAQAVFPSDFLASETAVDSQSRRISWTHPLFAERLEKGVIRRGRIAAWLLPRENDQTAALELWESFCHSPPPLTA